MTTIETDARLEEIRVIVAEVLEIETEELEDEADFVESYDADSLRAIEVLARLEKTYKIEVPQEELSRMENLSAVYDVIAEYAGW